MKNLLMPVNTLVAFARATSRFLHKVNQFRFGLKTETEPNGGEVHEKRSLVLKRSIARGTDLWYVTSA